MKHKLAFLCVMLAMICLLASCADDAESGLPGLEDAKKIQNGMTYFEAVEILGNWGEAVPTGIWYHEWPLDNGQTLRVVINDQDNEAPTVHSVQIVDDSFGTAGVNMYLKTMKVFYTIEEYNEYASGNDLLYEKSGENFIYASALQCLGEFERYYYTPASGGPNSYTYTFTDKNGIQIKVRVHENKQTIPYLDEDTPYLEAIPAGTANMSNIETDAWNAYYDRNGLLYCYTKSGQLSSIRWVDNNVCFTLSGNLDSYPMDGKDTLVKRMLSASDQEAENAWNELKGYIRNNNRKPATLVQILTWTGAAVLVVGAGVGALLIIRKQRAKKVIVPREDPETGAPE